MQMYLIYVDESYDTTHFAYSALFVPAFEWNRVFDDILRWRKELFLNQKIPLDYELHATNFIGGRGEPNENRDKNYRASIFSSAFSMMEKIGGVFVLNGITNQKKEHLKLFEYMPTGKIKKELLGYKKADVVQPSLGKRTICMFILI